MLMHAWHSGNGEMLQVGRSWSKLAWAKKQNNHKIITAKSTGGMVQVVECLPTKHKALSSNLETTREKKKKKEKEKKRCPQWFRSSISSPEYSW
jgi:hypothetical protein